ncbi:MAG: hypothetical protein P9M14_17185 [Candidatus Alcyoniella australis]|nr:hypothetical protein [Candidatus Alcyoniella australis]
MQRSSLTVAALVAAILSLLVILSCGAGDGCSAEDGNLKVRVTLPLLPIDLPIFPTDVTLEGLEDWVGDELDDLGWVGCSASTRSRIFSTM